MDENSTLAVTAARALETADQAHALWSDADREWASRAAAQIVGEGASPQAFVARRANLVLERAGEGHRALTRAVAALRWRPWVGAVVIALAFVAGAIADPFSGERRINVLAPPALALIAWNLAVFVVMIGAYVVRYGEASAPGPLRRALVRLAGGAAKAPPGALGTVVGGLAVEWARLAAPLHGARAARVLHCAAAALALGVIAGFYLRGIAFDYQASWESTFFGAPTTHRIVATAYAPGAALTGIAMPSVEAIAAIRAPAGENAARWLHLIAATLLLLVIVPRLLLALFTGLVERHRARRIDVDFEAPYFRRLLRGFRGGAARVRVLPYSYSPPPACVAGLETLLARGFGGSAALSLLPAVAYGSDAPLPATDAQHATTIALFNATATPESDVHGAFLTALRSRGGELIALVDTSAFAARVGAGGGVPATRLAAWRELAGDAQVPVLVVNLAAPDLAAVDAALDSALDARNRTVRQ